ncbi:hypothetical protein TNCV_3598951 [Trichonephila clavipes]|nr:hypothetical protein TNCV_3598951 [Trichonephila clavipes]
MIHLCDRKSLVVRVTDSYQACFVFELVPQKADRVEGLMHVKCVKAQSSPVGVLWKFREGGTGSDIVLIT